MPKVWTPGQGERLKAFRKAVGMTQEVVAERLGISWMTVHRWEKPDDDQHIRAVPFGIMKQLSVIYGVTMRQLVPGYTPAWER